jgi:putative ABC transport system ATP-binding protein
MIKVKDLHKIYGIKKNPFEALKGINFEVSKGESVAIIGKSGSGKSTLMHLLAGLDTATSGEIWLDNQEISKLSAKELAVIRNDKFGFVFQQFFLQPRNTVLENVMLPLKIHGVSRKDAIRRGMEALEEVGLADKAKNKATDLSGGQKQRVAIARAIVTEPSIIFADEPTGNLDSETGDKVINLLFDLNKKKGITLVVVTHDTDLAGRCDRQIHIKDGQIVPVKTETKA